MKTKADKHREAGTLDAFRARQAASRASTARYQEARLNAPREPEPDLLEMRKDAERYRKLAAAAKEQLLRPDRAACEMLPDMRTHWVLPVLMCSGPVGGFASFADAVDRLPDGV